MGSLPLIRSLDVDLGERSYQIKIGRGLIDQADRLLAPLLKAPKTLIITDSHVAQTDHLGRLTGSFERAGIDHRVFEIPAGEQSKSLLHYGSLVEEILAGGIDRKTSVVALGGGVVGDLAGFAASSLLRGLDFYQMPTSLLAQVDSSVGGKTGINSATGKNLIGAFHQPKLVLLDTGVLGSLPEREFKSGYAELVKHAFIRDPDLFEWLDRHLDKIVGARDDDLLAEAIERSVRIKAMIVAEDETETSGVRALLNFGHTFGHAYEAAAGYDGRLLHGEAVSIGMVKAFALSAALEKSNGAELVRARDHLVRAGLPVAPRAELGCAVGSSELIARMERDKKAYSGKLNFVLSRRIGEAFLAYDVAKSDICGVL